MSVYKKMQEARCLLQKKSVKKTGKNQKFNYYQLDDILPPINEINEQVGLCPVVSFNKEEATLTVYDVDGEGSITFSAPMASAKLPNGQAIQNLGASITYERRYLYMTAYEITEHDAVDALSDADKKAMEPKKMTEKVEKDYFDKVDCCDTVEDLTELYGEIQLSYIVNEPLKKAFSLRRELIESGEVLNYQDKHGV